MKTKFNNREIQVDLIAYSYQQTFIVSNDPRPLKHVQAS